MGTFRGIELDELELSGPHLVLRPWRPDDADRVLGVMQDRSMRDFLALPDPYTGDDAQRFVSGVGAEGRDTGAGIGSAMVERAGGRVVGACALRLSADGEIGFWVAPDARGHGYAAQACRILADWAFGVEVPRVRLVCDVRNLASARTALAAGFSFEGIGRDVITGGGSGGVPRRRFDAARFARLAADSGDRVRPAFAALPADGLTDGVVLLRATAPDDAQGLYETDDELTLAWSFDGVAHPLDAARRATARAGLDWLVGRAATLTMIDVATDAFAGQLSLRLAGPPQIGGVGYVVHPAFRGRGFTARSLRLLVPWAFETAGFARLELGAKVGNVASQRAAAAAGFEPDGVRRARLRAADGSFHDEVRFALVNPRYR